MKTRLIFAAMMVIGLLGCNDDDQSLDGSGTVSFMIPMPGNILEPASVIISMEDEHGKTILQDKVLSLSVNNQNYVTDEIPIDRGLYRVTKFIVLSDMAAVYASPRAGSQKATLINQSLPLEFKITGNQSVISPALVGIANPEEPELFGYIDFVYDGIEEPSEEWMDIRVKYELTIGQTYYEDMDVEFIVKAYDVDNAEQWTERFKYIGPQANDLRIKNGFHHYRIETAKWGSSTDQTFTHAHLWNARVREGAVPTTYIFAQSMEPKKISNYVRSGLQMINGEAKMVPNSKAVFEYDSEGRVKFIDYLVYRVSSGTFVPDQRSEFSYNANRVIKIRMYEVGTNTTFSEDYYTYDPSGKLLHIRHQELSGIVTEVELLYSGANTINALYSLSNGNSFAYELNNESGNLNTDKTTRGSQTCSEGVFTYDKNVNPLKYLGYVDFLFRNYSNSNRLTEDVNYIGCAFPQLVPESYQYVYDADGYPTVATTFYRTSVYKTQIEYFYQ